MDTIKTRRITIRLSQDDYDYLALKSADYDLPIAVLVRQLIKRERKKFEGEVEQDG